MSSLRHPTPFLTTYDFVKCLALVLMFVDHVGYFFMPDNEWMRVIGRGSLPIWAFLIGYATSRDVKRLLPWAWGLLVINILCGGPVLPLNIIFTFIVTRLLLDRSARIMFAGWEILIYAFTFLAVMAFPTIFAVEYGTNALLLALCGYVMRHSGEVGITKRVQIWFICAATAFHALMQILTFNFADLEAKGAAFVIGAAMLLMYFFKPLELPGATEKTPRPFVWLVQLGGRYTLEIYVLHMAIFKIIAATYGLEGHGFFAFKLLP